ncbi:hypothetical protein UPYG_G00013850 [Umbra pygmaea]|uniref:Cadherin domain-containing protein n=1 Tax=Umbra pygmaea TaxID=75934 RepID=A0ABD0XLV8_UMBPY
MAKMFLYQLLAFMTVALALAHDIANDALNKRDKRNLLVRSKRRWVLSTFELTEEDPGPFPKLVTQMFNDHMDMLKNNRKFRLTGNGVTEEPLGLFYIHEDGSVYVTKSIDREKYPLFNIKFDILDKETGIPVDRTLAFDVKIKDINDNAPTFEETIMTGEIPENLQEGYLPVQLKPTDTDEENTVNSTVSVKVVSQTPAEPKISVKYVEGSKMNQLAFTGCFDYDKEKSYVVEIEAKDHGTPALSSTATVILKVTDSNTHPPVFKNNTYKTEIKEMESDKEILRVAVTDGDTPNTPGWRAVYTIVKGNEDGNYKIVTDPKTNEGVLTVIKGKDFERTTLTNVVIAVKNEEPLFVCNSGRAKAMTASPITANVTVKVIDVNDPPVFVKKVTDVYEKGGNETRNCAL